VTGDIFENASASPTISVLHTLPSRAVLTHPSIELGGPWSFYRDFRLAHGLERIPQLDVPEIAIAADGMLEIPVWLRNPTSAEQIVKLTVTVPADWTVKSGADLYSLRPDEVGAVTIEIAVPQLSVSETKSKETSEVSVNGESSGQSVGTIKLHVQLRAHALPQ
jgi:hypothetical protein